MEIPVMDIYSVDDSQIPSLLIVCIKTDKRHYLIDFLQKGHVLFVENISSNGIERNKK